MNREWLERRIAARRSLPTKAVDSGTASIEGVCAKIQAGCAIVALALAIFAYTAWKNQETAKRQADVAMEILRNVHSSSQCLRRNLSIFAKQSPTREEIAQIAREGLDAIDRCTVPLARLSADVLVARTLLDVKTSTALSTLDTWATHRRGMLEVLNAQGQTALSVDTTKEPESADLIEGSRKEFVMQALRLLGARRMEFEWIDVAGKKGRIRIGRTIRDEAPDGQPVKSAPDVLEEYVAGIESLLAKYIHFR